VWSGSEPTSKPTRQPFSQAVGSSAFTARSRRWSTQPNAAVRPVEAALQNAFKSQAAMMERITKVALDAAEKSTEVSTKRTKTTLEKAGDAATEAAGKTAEEPVPKASGAKKSADK